MRQFFTSASSTTSDWLVFLAVLVGACFFTGVFIVWFTVFRKPGKKRRKRHHHRRHKNPTLAETGGLPPVRHGKKSDAPPSS